MSLAASFDATAAGPAPGWGARLLRRIPRLLRLALLGMFILGASQGISDVLRSPAASIARALERSAATLRALSPAASAETVRAAIQRRFGSRAVAIDTSSLPSRLEVTVPGLDRETCASLIDRASRIEGFVVIELQGYAGAAQCGERNQMTWRLMP